MRTKDPFSFAPDPDPADSKRPDPTESGSGSATLVLKVLYFSVFNSYFSKVLCFMFHIVMAHGVSRLPFFKNSFYGFIVPWFFSF